MPSRLAGRKSCVQQLEEVVPFSSAQRPGLEWLDTRLEDFELRLPHHFQGRVQNTIVRLFKSKMEQR